MSMRPRAPPEIPERTVVVVRAAFPKGALAIRVRDELGEVFADGAFIDAFGVQGRPGVSPGQLTMVTVLQFAENLTDRQLVVEPAWFVDVTPAGRAGSPCLMLVLAGEPQQNKGCVISAHDPGAG